MRFLNRYLVVAMFVVGLMSSGGFSIDSCCSAATVCPECKKEHEGRCASHYCAQCGKTHEGKCAQSRQSQGLGKAAGGGKAATFKAAFTGVGSSRVGNLTAGLSVIQSQGANLVSTLTPPSYGYNKGY